MLVLDFNAALGAGFQELLNERSAPGHALALITHHAAGAAETRIRHRTDLAELNADILFEPVNARGNVVGVGAV